MMITKRDATGRIAKGSGLRHGLSNSPEYDCWVAMKARCSKPNHPCYQYYGGKGIKVCDRWLHSFDAFLLDMGRRPQGMTLDRINVDGNYEPTNCRWLSLARQQLNKSSNTAHPGVSYEASRDSYNVRIVVKGKRFNLGRYKTVEQAMDIRLAAERQYAI